MTGKNGKKPEKYSISFEPPSDESPGYLRLQRNVLALNERIKRGEFTPDMIDAMIEVLLPYVTAPINRDEAREALLDVSKKQYQQMLNAVVGKPVDDSEVAVEVVPPE
jgi:hypothetical protein